MYTRTYLKTYSIEKGFKNPNYRTDINTEYYIKIYHIGEIRLNKEIPKDRDTEIIPYIIKDYSLIHDKIGRRQLVVISLSTTSTMDVVCEASIHSYRGGLSSSSRECVKVVDGRASMSLEYSIKEGKTIDLWSYSGDEELYIELHYSYVEQWVHGNVCRTIIRLSSVSKEYTWILSKNTSTNITYALELKGPLKLSIEYSKSDTCRFYIKTHLRILRSNYYKLQPAYYIILKVIPEKPLYTPYHTVQAASIVEAISGKAIEIPYPFIIAAIGAILYVILVLRKFRELES